MSENIVVQLLQKNTPSNNCEEVFVSGITEDRNQQPQRFYQRNTTNNVLPRIVQLPQTITPRNLPPDTLVVTPKVTVNNHRTTNTIFCNTALNISSLKRPLDSTSPSTEYTSYYRKYNKNPDKSKGLRHFSAKVCEKVKEKGSTNYSEVADELVKEYFDSLPSPPISHEKQQYDMKNIRRRVYDALNVLMAMNIIDKERKQITWVGLPTSSLHECRRLVDDKAQRLERLARKREQLLETMAQLVAHKNLINRNKEYEEKNGHPEETSIVGLPYIVVSTGRDTTVNCEITNDKTEFTLNFDSPFEILDDIVILKNNGLSLGLEKPNPSKELIDRCKKYLPESVQIAVEKLLNPPDFEEKPPKVERPVTTYSPPHKVSVVRVSSNCTAVPRRPVYRVKREGSTISLYTDRTPKPDGEALPNPQRVSVVRVTALPRRPIFRVNNLKK
uniref:Transcription factor Dp-1 n=1 Tax=Parastrongyloides trichosuri TaxID=131310 RepID=A0A0N4Z919_PARTI